MENIAQSQNIQALYITQPEMMMMMMETPLLNNFILQQIKKQKYFKFSKQNKKIVSGRARESSCLKCCSKRFLFNDNNLMVLGT